MFEQELREAVSKVTEQYIAIHDEIERIWAQQMVFTWHWWIDLALSVLPWILWIKVRDKINTHRLLYAGMFTAFIATVLDRMGVSQGRWNYDTWLLPFLPEYLPWDWTVMPVTAMLFYQFFPKINPFLKGAFFGGFASYVVEPVFLTLGFYKQTGWKHHYSLPVYIVIYMIGYWLYTRRFPPLESKDSFSR